MGIIINSKIRDKKMTGKYYFLKPINFKGTQTGALGLNSKRLVGIYKQKVLAVEGTNETIKIRLKNFNKNADNNNRARLRCKHHKAKMQHKDHHMDKRLTFVKDQY